jgi:chromosome segregation protein
VYLKSLTLRGFKSFASSTTLEFEPGVTCVVGPNGSGKSNVVDALAWVMGEQGAKSLRGGKMEDVIFAGTAGRAPLGRAEVLLTIDNSDGALPIDFAEVTISRIMFRNGGSEYAINGEPCRLLDVQELLSDSGIGREMHVIVGQGQLDTILHATPEDRRGFIEEAAGVLKHRKRKEKALRKLDAMQANLTRVQDLTTELRRQLTPLGKQAEVARRAQVIQTDLRDARSRILADDILQLRTSLEAEIADETALRERRLDVETSLSEVQSREAVLEAELQADAPLVARAQETWFRLSSLRERYLGTISLAADRVRVLAPEEDAGPLGRDPEELDAEARAARAEELDLGKQVEADRAVLSTAVRLRADAEAAFTAETRRLADAERAAADRRNGRTHLVGQVEAARQRIEARDAERERLVAQIANAKERAEQAQRDFATLESQVAGLTVGEAGLDDAHERSIAALGDAQSALEKLRAEESANERERAALAARVEALSMALKRHDGGAHLLAASSEVSGLLGSVAALIKIRPGFESAIAVALGEAADAVAIDDLDSAISAIERLKSGDGGRAAILLSSANDMGTDPVGQRLPNDHVLAADVVDAPASVRAALRNLLRGVVVVPNLQAARTFVRERPSAIAVTREGDLLSRVAGGSRNSQSLVEVQSALSEAEERLAAIGARSETLRFELVSAQERVSNATNDVERTLSALHESDASMAAVAEQLGQFGSVQRSALGEAERLDQALEASTQAREADVRTLTELEQRLAALDAEPEATAPDGSDRDRLAQELDTARSAEVEARLAVRTGEERQRAAVTRAETLERAAREERDSRRRAVERRERRAREAATAAAVLAGAKYVLTHLEVSLEAAADARADAERQRTARDGELLALRTRGRELAAELETLVDSVHRDEMARTEQRLRIEQIESRALEELGLDVETLIAEFGPDQLVPPSPPAPGDEVDPNAPEPQPYPYVREQQEKRLKAAEKAMNLLGKVNPLALEEYAALEERHRFLNEQLDDLKRSRADLLSIIRDVDDRVQQVFAEAFADTAREFEGIFSRLFPGGEGKLILTDPENLLTTGIEVEARPPGKKVKRLSLLSGGERSLTAVAFLVALFKARPSPFYVMDEVEAALDDVNLGRLIDLISELKSSSQLIVITHQKRTMEIADALYGVTMRGDGVTQVISQRLQKVSEEANA